MCSFYALVSKHPLIVCQRASFTCMDGSRSIMKRGAMCLRLQEQTTPRTAASNCRWCLLHSNLCTSHTVFLMRQCICIEVTLVWVKMYAREQLKYTSRSPSATCISSLIFFAWIVVFSFLLCFGSCWWIQAWFILFEFFLIVLVLN